MIKLKNFAKKLRKLLEEGNVSQTKLAKDLEFKNRQRVQDWLSGKSQPKELDLEKLVKYFHLDDDYFLKPDDEDPHAIDTKNFGNNNTIITGHHNTTEVNNTQQSGATNPPVFSATTPEEAELLQLYRSLTPAQRSAFLTLAKTLK